MSHKNPIIFNDWSIQRILAGEKTQTRQIVKPQPDEVVQGIPVEFTSHEVVDKERNELVEIKHGEDGGRFYKEVECPYGQPDDVLWVREAFRMPVGCDDKYTPKEYVSSSGYTHGVPGRFRYEADGKRAYEVAGNRDACAVEWGRKRPPIHMPRELCRLRLRVEDVCVERVQEISYEDVVAEGFEAHVDRERYGQKRTVKYPWSLMKRDDLTDTGHSVQSYDYAFKKLWNDIHGDGAWERNDWVWVIKFSLYDE